MQQPERPGHRRNRTLYVDTLRAEFVQFAHERQKYVELRDGYFEAQVLILVYVSRRRFIL